MIGEKIKAIRMEKKITAKELAERVEVTPAIFRRSSVI